MNHTVYSASKGALDSITSAMALELAPHKIRVNSINPTVVMTDMGRIGWSEPKKANEMLSKIPMGRFAGNHHTHRTSPPPSPAHQTFQTHYFLPHHPTIYKCHFLWFFKQAYNKKSIHLGNKFLCKK